AFGLAYSRLMIVTAFGSNLNLAAPSAEGLVAPALRLVERLPPRQRDILFATAALWQGKRVEALRLADALGQRYPDDADAAYAQGEIYFHFGLSVGAAPRVALEPFERAIRLDPELIEAYIHAIELRCVVGDTGQAWALLDSGLATAPRFFPFWAIQAAMRAGLRGEDPAALEPGLRGLASLSGLALIRASIEVRRVLDHDPARAIRVADAFVQLAAAPEQPHSLQAQAWRLGALFRLAQGRHREAWAAGHQALGLEPTSVAALAFTAVYPLITGREQNAGFLAQRDLRTAEPAAATLVIVAWAAREQRDSATYAFAVRALDSATAGRVVRDYTERRLAGLRGLGALQDGDTARARAQLEIASDASSQLAPFIETVPDIYFALRLARLERAAGAHDDALRRLYAMSLDNSGGLVYRAEAEELRGKIADERGDSAAAIRAYRNFIELWKDADPELQPRVAEARVALARLEGR
ncbi:MAG TPA: tetratricopeptide repeat protein, partial [Gemmatimonadales bacterium]|nr:tetratricopeptide repeat protein [Gemmatimonadales bacterium]